MSEEKQPNNIDEIINALDFNLNSLGEARGMTMADVKLFFLDILGTIRDMWERLQGFFEEMDKLKEIEKAAKKGKTYEKKEIKDPEIRRLFI